MAHPGTSAQLHCVRRGSQLLSFKGRNSSNLFIPFKGRELCKQEAGCPFISPSITEVAITVLFKLPRACAERSPDINSAVQKGKQREKERSTGHVCLQTGAALVPVDCAKCDGCEHGAIFE